MDRVLVAALVIASAACDRTSTSSAPPAGSAARPAIPSDGCTLHPVALRYPAPGRLVAIGDLHGDLAATRAALRAAGAIDATDHWSGGELVVVQTGDVLDRGDDEQEILDLLLRLEGEAKAAGGALILLLGNHELMNAAGDFRYVTRGALSDFGGGREGRVAALRPGGPYARKLAAHAVIAIVGDTVFSHAGVAGEWVAQVEQVNRTARCWLDGQRGDRPAALTADDSPTWTRVYGGDAVDCAAARGVLAKLGVKRMVVGHTVQQRGINDACDGAVWRIDVGLAAGYGGPIEVLELAGDTAKVLHGSRL